MKKSSRSIWTVRLLALLVMSFGISLLISLSPNKNLLFKKRVEIIANDNVEEIINAIENLGRNDVNIKTKSKSWCARKPLFLWFGMGMFVLIGFCLAVYHAIYCIIGSLLNRKERDDNLLKPTS